MFVDPSADSSPDSDICKYYGSPTGCARGSKCFYRHGEGELWNSKSRVSLVRSTVLAEYKRKIFVGGLPPSLDSSKKFSRKWRIKPSLIYNFSQLTILLPLFRITCHVDGITCTSYIMIMNHSYYSFYLNAHLVRQIH